MGQDIASVVVTYNRKALLAEAIQSLCDQTYQLKKIIIIDNASTDGSKEYLESLGLIRDNVDYIRMESNLGGSAGFYYGIKKALDYQMDWICLSDDDAIFNMDYFSKIVNAMDKAPTVKAFTGTVKTENKIQIEHRRRIVNNIILKQEPCELDIYKNKSFEIDVFSFVGCVIHMDIIREIGLPEKGFFIWMDDTEYSLRVNRKTKVLNITDAVINHRTNLIENRSYKPNWKEYYGLRNEFFTISKHSTHPSLGKIFILLKVFKLWIETLSKKDYRGYRNTRLKIISDAFQSFVFHKKGKNQKYVPTKNL